VYRLSSDQAGGLNQIDQIGVELVGDASVEADAEVIALADEALRNAGVKGSTIQLGDVGLILEAVTAAGLPAETRKAIVETLADAAASGKGLEHVENALEHWADWLGDQSRHKATGQSVQSLPGHDLQRLFHHLVPEVVGRRTESDILGRLQQKWAMSERLPDALTKAARLVHELGGLAGEPAQVFAKLKTHPTGSLAEKSRQRLSRLVDLLINRHGIEASRIRIDLGVARGIGFYSGLTFSFHGAGSKGVELAGGGRYDGLISVLGLHGGPDFGVGFAIGLERVIQSVGQSEVAQTSPVYVLQPHDESVEATRVAIGWIGNLRSKSQKARLATPGDQVDASGQIWIEVSADGEAQCADSRQLVEFNQKLTAERLIES
jgi:histidyl-tRNA synthetase